MSMEYLDWFLLCLRFRKKMTHPSAYWPSNLKIHKHSELCLLTLECANPQAKWAKRAMPIDPRICKSASTSSCAHWPLNLQIHKHSERNNLCLLTPKGGNPQAQWKSTSTSTLKSANAQAQRAKRAVLTDPKICISTNTASKVSCTHWPSNVPIHKHIEQIKLFPLTLESANLQAMRVKRAVPIDPQICKSTGPASEASCSFWLLNLQIQKHSERSELRSLTLKSANPQAQRAKRDVSIDSRICTSTASEASRFVDSRVNGHSWLSSLCLSICTFEGQWAQLAAIVDLQIRGSVGTACFALCACGFAYLKVGGHSSLRPLCL